MLSLRTIEPHTLELLKALMQEPALCELRLVGGTALALQYGHRSSVDLDFDSDGDIDYTYFNEFFRSQSSGSLLNGKKKKITIITWDEESRSDILLQLRKMDVDIQKLYGQSNFQLIRTSCNEDKGKYEELCDRLKRQPSDREIISRLIG